MAKVNLGQRNQKKNWDREERKVGDDQINEDEEEREVRWNVAKVEAVGDRENQRQYMTVYTLLGLTALGLLPFISYVVIDKYY